MPMADGMDRFELLPCVTRTSARRGLLRTLHGTLETPVFMPVGTQATVKSLTPERLRSIGVEIILGNTYHLSLRPGAELIGRLGGLHAFMGWDGPILTDSGGYQVYSLAKLRRVSDDGIDFRSHLDGSRLFLGPRQVIDIQRKLGSDIAMVIDECAPSGCTEEEARRAVDRSVRWARECLAGARDSGFLAAGHQIFGIVQGSVFKSLRRACAEQIAQLPLSGFAVGGVSVGETESEMLQQVAWVVPLLPEAKPRYLMGVGTPPQLLKNIALGVDMFDCVMPTREARHGSAFTPWGKINLRNQRFHDDPRPLVEDLDNYTCRCFSRAYIRHLIMAGEILGGVLLSLHNLHFFIDLMKQARRHLQNGDFDSWHLNWIHRYEGGIEQMP